ncbi:2Fe-2S iron-sulfur cluster-binding protein [Actibacterium sp. 188UL27-1]|uniref:2Fe-2S iron-sulfur cluster-binding protein n=1 Tax=Actibacterium sp. 188UL27-1 TaxID=2786961 RepID=UPI00195888C5|nr:2Fe-2S iron-sulfur cluster-binding protein [Actibacterium sp. 188UL27-1]MBM7067839.1 2Fe-2S iron-sulfur cluster binding domain-containing protein [Actibacterium sp. 188UL27-1]
MARFHPLTVTHLHKTIRDAVVVTLKPDDPALFAFTQGQYLTFRHTFDGTELRRSYSICAGRDDGRLQVGIKKVQGGAFSTWANTDLKIGDRLEAMPPMGRFHTPLDPQSDRHYLAFAGGSGITPILSILRTVLKREPNARFTLVYANRAVNTIMFREELEDLKNHHMDRINIIHVLEQDAQEIDLFTGRVDAEKCALLFRHWVNISSIDTAFICGPEPMMLAIAGTLRDHGLQEDQIKFELFSSAQPGRVPQTVSAMAEDSAPSLTQARVVLGGESRSFETGKDVSLLDAALRNQVEAPYACRAGVCSTCRCRIVEGDVQMIANHALEDGEVAQGYVLSCQSYPITDRVVFDYDAAGH